MRNLAEDIQNLLKRARKWDRASALKSNSNLDRVHRIIDCIRRLGDQADELKDYERDWIMKQADVNIQEVGAEQRRRRLKEKWQGMTPIEKQEFRERLDLALNFVDDLD